MQIQILLFKLHFLYVITYTIITDILIQYTLKMHEFIIQMSEFVLKTEGKSIKKRLY